MASLWKHYDRKYDRYQVSHPPAFPWNREGRQDLPRFERGADGWWFDPAACDTGKALLSCTGDLMCEPRMSEACRYGDSFFFHTLFQYVRPILKGSDFAVGNLETTLSDATPYAGEYHRIAKKYHCNAPACYLDAVRYAGFDALVNANNHNCDSGIPGLEDTLHTLDSHGFMHTGTFLPGEREPALLVKINGIRVAILSYANRFNGLDERHLTREGIDTWLNPFNPEKCARDVAWAREKGAEFVLCYIHWGKDYDLAPNEQQLSELEAMKALDIDYIVGSHTHCLQAHHVATAENGKKIPMMWSMGNFVTNERQELCRHTGILQLMLRREQGKIAVREYFVPCYVFDAMGTGRFCAVPTDTLLNGGIADDRIPGIDRFIRQRIGPDLPFLPTGSVTLAQLCEAMGVALPEDLPDTPIVHLAVQPGTARPKALYFSMETPAVNEQRYLRKMDTAAIVTREPVEGFPCIPVADVKEAYLAACRALRPRVPRATGILVAGSHGKTLTRELCAHVLKAKGAVLTVADGYQPDMTLWQHLHPNHEFCLQELRADNPMGVTAATRAICPEICLVTGAMEGLGELAEAMAPGGLLLLNGSDPALTAQAADLNIPGLRIKTYSGAELPAPGLPLPHMGPCAQAAYALGLAVGLDEAAVKARIAAYRTDSCTENIISIDGVTLVLHLSCKTAAQARSVLEAAAARPGRKLALLAAPSLEPEALPQLIQAAEALADRVFCKESTDWEAEHALELLLLDALQEGDTLLLCGGREAELNLTLRQLFGLTDGFIPDSW